MVNRIKAKDATHLVQCLRTADMANIVFTHTNIAMQ